jgi:hypothetical protein
LQVTHTKVSAGETLSQRLKNLPYSTDKIGQGFVIHISSGIRESKIKGTK